MPDTPSSSSNDVYKNFRFGSFDPSTEQWDYYLQRFELELEMHSLMTDTTMEVRRNLLLSKIGSSIFKMLADHFKPDKVSTKTYDELINVLNRSYGKTIYIFAERINFAGCFRKETETVTQYAVNLRSLAGNCSFGASLDERMRDQLIFGINNREWQEKIIQRHSTNATTFDDVQATALLLEQASIQTKKLTYFQPNHLDKTDSYVNRVKKWDKRNDSEIPQKSEVRELDPQIDCFYCGELKHKQKNCSAFGKRCNACGDKNHFSRVCFTTGKATIKGSQSKIKSYSKNKLKHSTRCVKGNEPVNLSNSDSDSGSNDELHPSTSNIRKIGSSSKVMLNIDINEHSVDMLYDPGSVHAVIGRITWSKIGKPPLTKSADLIAYGDKPVSTLGKTWVDVKAFQTEMTLPIYVTREEDIPLFGLDWVLAFNLPLPPGARVCHVKENSEEEKGSNSITGANCLVNEVLKEFTELFENSLGTIRGHQAKIHISESVTPKQFRPRSVPLALQDQVSSELERLVKEGVLEPVDTTNTPISWASPIVVALKSNGSLRICADFKVTINKHVQVDDYPLPRFEDVTSKLSGGIYFSKIDLKDAYLQMEVHPDSRKYLVIATHKGYFTYRRLPFGISFAPSLFQRTMDQILAGIDGVVCYLDDILVTAQDLATHAERLREVLRRLQAAGVKTQRSKCDLLRTSVTYLGHKIDQYGLHPTGERVEAIKQMPLPQNSTQLRSFLGSITYYGRFIKNLHVKCVPLHRHLKKHAKWVWTAEDTRIFEDLKRCLASNDTLVHFDQEKPLVVTSDASNEGAGAVLSHEFPDGTLRPIAFASRSFSDVEKRYSTIDKEALGLVYAVTKFHQYLYGKPFILVTDHKPLERIFGENRETPKIASNRLLRWAMTLNSYNFNVIYKPGKENGPADSFSRLPLKNPSTSHGISSYSRLLHLRVQKLMPISKSLLKKETQKDEIFSKVIGYVKSYWPEKKNLDQDILSFYEKRSELSFEEDMLLWKGRICVPSTLRSSVLAMLHEGHPGTTAMQTLAKLHVYWPNINTEIAHEAENCHFCQQSRQNDRSAPLHPWGISPEPWSRLHLDFAGPFEGKMWMVVIDSYTRWLEILPVKNITSATTIEALRDIFARFGLPKFLVTDNGPQLTSGEFENFCSENGITHIKVTPYHPQSNGLAERAVRTFKERMRASDRSLTQSQRLAQFLFSYRNTTRRSTNRSPSQLMFGRNLRSRFDLIKPDVLRNMEYDKFKQKQYHDRSATAYQSFEEGEDVWVNNPLCKGSVPAQVVKQTGPLSYLVSVDGVVRRHHSDQMRKRKADILPSRPVDPNIEPSVFHDGAGMFDSSPTNDTPEDSPMSEIPSTETERCVESEGDLECERTEESTSSQECPLRRNPPRNRRPPARYC